MTKSAARFASACLFTLFPISALLAADADNPPPPPVIIERAPEAGQAQSQEELAALRTENQRLSKELTHAREVLERLRADAVAVAADRAKESAAAESGAKELTALREKISQIENNASAKGAASDAARKNLDTAQGEISALTNRIRQLETSLEARKKELHETLVASAAANERIVQLSAPKADDGKAAQQLAAEKSRADEAITRLNTIIASVDKLTADNAALQTQLAEARKNESALRGQLTAAQAKPEPTAAAPDLTAKLADTENKLAASARSVALLQSENELLKTASADNARLNAELQTLRQQKATQDSQSPELNAKIADLQGKLNTTLRSYTLMQSENDQLKAASAENARVTAELQSLRQEKAAAAAAAPSPDLTAKVADLDQRLATSLRSYSLLQAENDQLKKAASDATRQGSEIEALRQKNAELEAKLAEVPAAPDIPAPAPANTDAENKLNTVLRSYSLLQAENDRLKADAAQIAQSSQSTAAKASGEAASQMSALFDELRQTKASVTALSAENSQLKTRLALAGSPPGTTMASPSRPGSAAAIAAATPAPASVEPAKPASASGTRVHVVVAGDTLGKIARQYYGSASRWEDILRANPDVIKDANVLPMGASLRIP